MRKVKGFTLIELLIVVAIIAILAAIARLKTMRPPAPPKAGGPSRATFCALYRTNTSSGGNPLKPTEL